MTSTHLYSGDTGLFNLTRVQEEAKEDSKKDVAMERRPSTRAKTISMCKSEHDVTIFDTPPRYTALKIKSRVKLKLATLEGVGHIKFCDK